MWLFTAKKDSLTFNIVFIDSHVQEFELWPTIYQSLLHKYSLYLVGCWEKSLHHNCLLTTDICIYELKFLASD